MKNGAIKRLHFGSLIDIEELQGLLEQEGIRTMIRDQFSEGLSAGFPDGPPNEVDLYVLEPDLEKCLPILKGFLNKR